MTMRRVRSVQQSIKQNAPVHDSHGFGFQPSHHDAARWPGKVETPEG
jgi:hypothetical protein